MEDIEKYGEKAIEEIREETVDNLDPFGDEVFLSFLKDNKIYKMYRQYFAEGAEDRRKLGLRMKYPEQFLSGGFIWHKTEKGVPFWTQKDILWKKISSVYRETILKAEENENIQNQL